MVIVNAFNCQSPFSKGCFFTGVTSNFEMRLLVIDSSQLQGLVYQFVANLKFAKISIARFYPPKISPHKVLQKQYREIHRKVR